MPADPMTAIFAIMLGVSAVGTGISAYAALNQPSPPKAPTQTATQTQVAQTEAAAAQAQAQALMKRRGMASTMLTSPMGVASTPTGQKSTLG